VLFPGHIAFQVGVSSKYEYVKMSVFVKLIKMILLSLCDQYMYRNLFVKGSIIGDLFMVE